MSLLKKVFAKIKCNYQFLFSILLLFLILIIAINPNPYIETTLKGFSIWAKIVLPSLFAFFIITKLFMQQNKSISIFNFLNKPFNKIYKSGNVSGYVFVMSVISGYPLGANLTREFYSNNIISQEEALRLIPYTSTSGPMFILGSLGASLFNNMNLAVVILISHLSASLINGLLYKKLIFKREFYISKQHIKSQQPLTKESLNEIMYNSIISCLMVGGYIALCFTLLEVLNNLNLFKPLSALINSILPYDSQVGESFIKGIIELTNGCVSLSENVFPLKTLAICLSGITSFGGLSIHLQSQMFLSKCGIKYKYFLLTKITHCILAIIISCILSTIFL